MRRGFTVLAAAIALIVLAGCRAGPEDSTALADRWLRVGEDLRTEVSIHPGALPPGFADLLNPGVPADAPDRMALPVHPEGTLLGAYHLRRSDGMNLMWLIYDVAGVAGEVSAMVASQLDESPWQVIGGQGNEALNVVSFQNTRFGEIGGSAIVQENPSTEEFQLTVEREGSETVLTVTRAAPVPMLDATYGSDLVVTRVNSGAASRAGLREGDRILRVGDTAVDSPVDLDVALRGLLSAGERRSSITYVVRVEPEVMPQEPTFVPPTEGIALPASFPSSDVWAGLTPVDFGWSTQQGGRFFQATFLSEESSGAVTSRLRDGLEAAGWEILADAPVGFATQLQIGHRDDGYVGQVQIDASQRDQSLVEVVVIIQTGAVPGN